MTTHEQWHYSRHARIRMAQRNVDPRLFSLVQRYGQRLHIHGDIYYFLGASMVPEELADNDWFKAIRNTMVVVSADATVKTVWKDRHALQKLRRRQFTRRRPSYPHQQFSRRPAWRTLHAGAREETPIRLVPLRLKTVLKGV